jgi:predicted RNase H-like nuclease (RuvC/YqgF family)
MANETPAVQKDNKAQNKEERPTTYKLQDFLSEMIIVIRDKLTNQNNKIERLRTDINLIKQNDIESMRRKIKELEQKVQVLEKRLGNQKSDIDGRILDNLRRS